MNTKCTLFGLTLALSQTLSISINAQDTHIIYQNNMPGYSYLLTINGEPVIWDRDQGIGRVWGFPIQKGTNNITLEVHSVSDNAHLDMKEYKCWIEVLIKQSNKFEHIFGVRSMLERGLTKWNTNIIINAARELTENIYDKNETNKNLEAESRRIAMMILNALAKRRLSDLERIFGKDNARDITGSFPKWVMEESEDNIIVSVGQQRDMGVRMGDYLILIYPKPGNDMDLRENLLCIKHKEKNMSYELNMLLLARVNKQWVMVMKGGGYMNIISDILQKAIQ